MVVGETYGFMTIPVRMSPKKDAGIWDEQFWGHNMTGTGWPALQIEYHSLTVDKDGQERTRVIIYELLTSTLLQIWLGVHGLPGSSEKGALLWIDWAKTALKDGLAWVVHNLTTLHSTSPGPKKTSWNLHCDRQVWSQRIEIRVSITITGINHSIPLPITSHN